MNQTATGVLAAIGALVAIFLIVFAALAAYDAVSGSAMMDDMGDMIGDMGDMMDDDMGGMMGGSGPETTGSASGQGAVRIEDFRFEPTTLNVTPGTVVVWTNEDSAPHTATANDDAFDTGRLDKGESGEVTFHESGTFEYICDVHPRMHSRIVVGP